MIKGIFFDAAGILYTRAGPTEAFALKLLQDGKFDPEISSESLQKQEALRSQASKGNLNHEDYWDQFLLMRGVLENRQRKAMIGQIIDYSNNVQPTPKNRETLASLKQRGYLLGIITDTMYPIEWKMRRLEKAGVAEFIDVVACSSVLGAHKPDPIVYSEALHKANLMPAESVFVGHLGIELQGASRSGMITIAIDPDQGARADHTCGSLADLLNLPILSGPCKQGEV